MADKIWIFVLVLPVAVFGAVLASTNRRLMVYALPFLAAMNGVSVKVGGQRVRFDQLFAVFLVLGFIPALLVGRRRLKIDTPAWWLIALVLCNVVSSLLFSPEKAFSLMEILSVGASWSIYGILLNTLTDRRGLDRFVTAVLVAGILEASFGVAAFGIGVAGFPVYGANTKSVTDFLAAFGAYGTIYEPNMFGSYCAGYFVLATGMAWVGWRYMTATRRGLVRVLMVVSVLGLMFSFTRGAWLGAMAGLAGLGILANRALGRRFPVRALIITITVGAAAVTGGWFVPGPIGEFIQYKLTNIVNPTTDSGITRLVTYVYAWDQYLKHPILGTGTYSFEPLIAGGSVDFTSLGFNLWIGNYLLLALHDTGIPGVITLLGFLISLIRLGVRASRRLWATNRPLDRSLATTLVPATAVVISYMVSFIFTTALSFGFPWVFMGLIGAHAALAQRLNPPLPEPQTKARTRRQRAAPRLAAGVAGPQ